MSGKAWTAADEKATSPPGLRLPITDGEEFWDEVRRQFDLPTATYLNTGTLGLMPAPVMATIQSQFESLSKGKYAIDEGPRQAIADLLNAPLNSISMTHNTTEGINIAAQGLQLKRGDEVILTDQEHVGNALPWLNRARLSGLRIRVVAPGQTAAETLNRINALITRRTRVIAVPHVTCTVGHVLPTKAIAQLARDKNIISVVDGAHGPGMLFPDMAALGCDIYATCGHKWMCGPAGTGMLYVRPELLPKVDAVMVGAYSDTGWEVSMAQQRITGFAPTAHRFDYGTQNVALEMGLKAAVEFMSQIGHAKIRERILDLAAYLQGRLLERPFIEMLTPTEPESRGAIIGFKVKGKTIKEVEQWAYSNALRVRFVAESGLNAVRVSSHIYTNHADLDQFVNELDDWMRA